MKKKVMFVVRSCVLIVFVGIKSVFIVFVGRRCVEKMCVALLIFFLKGKERKENEKLFVIIS